RRRRDHRGPGRGHHPGFVARRGVALPHQAVLVRGAARSARSREFTAPETGTTVGATRRRATRGRRRVQWTSPAHGIAAEGTHRANGGSGADGADRTPGGAVGDRMRPRHPTLPAECPAVPGAFRGNRPGRGAVALRRYGPPRTPLPLAGMTSKPLPMRVG